MEDLLKFYRTPIGAKLLLVNGKMMTDGARAGEEVVKRKQEEFTKRVEVEFIKTFTE